MSGYNNVSVYNIKPKTFVKHLYKCFVFAGMANAARNATIRDEYDVVNPAGEWTMRLLCMG